MYVFDCLSFCKVYYDYCGVYCCKVVFLSCSVMVFGLVMMFVVYYNVVECGFFLSLGVLFCIIGRCCECDGFCALCLICDPYSLMCSWSGSI